jgi:hypothetical protein
VSVISANISRCLDAQDIAICEFIASGDVHSTLVETISFNTLLIESTHPYTESFTLQQTVEITGGVEYEINMFKWTDRTAVDLKFCANANCSKPYATYTGSDFPGVTSPTLTISAAKFYVYYKSISCTTRSRGSFPCWGYRITVRATIKAFDESMWVCGDAPAQAVASLKRLKSMGGLDHLSQGFNIQATSSYASDFCDWAGITCDSGIITAIDLHSYGIAATIPSSVGDLTGLRTLDIGGNAIAGTLPSTLGQLTNLQLLDVSSNKIQGSLPSSLGNLPFIQYLYFANNEITGTLPASFSNLSESLLVLSISNNLLTGKLDEQLCVLGDARIDVSGNQDIVCYEPCWDNFTNNVNIGNRPLCAPTSIPTSQPTRPTNIPTSRPTRGIAQPKTSSSSFNILFVIPIIVSVCCLSAAIYFLYLYHSKRHIRDRSRALLSLPVHRAIIEELPEEDVLNAIKAHR